MSAGPRNAHGTALVVGDRGILIVGRSGAGKTALALALIDAAASRGRFARLVADDQIFVSAVDGKVVAEAPSAIRGLVEIRGLHPTPCASEDKAVIDLIVRLAAADEAPRFQDGRIETLAGVAVPSLVLAERAIRTAMPAIAAFLRL